MAELDLLTEIHSDVKYIKKTLDEHIVKDDKIVQDYIKPLWESHQQRIGAAGLAGLMYSVVGSVVTVIVGIFSGMIHR